MDTTRILIVEDDSIVLRLASSLLAAEGYEVVQAEDGREGLSKAFTMSPDLVVLDRGLPELDGLEVLRRLRAHFFTNHIPVILLTSRAEVEDRVEGLGAGADDYVAKPFDKREFLARVSATLRRSRHSLAADPLTKLPGNIAVREHMDRQLARGVPCSVAYIDLDNFKAYVDSYGFEDAARVIQKTAQTLYNAVIDHGAPDDFIGHIGGDDFLLIASPETVEPVTAALVGQFDEAAPGFYGDGDRDSGHLEAKDRYGTTRQFPFVSLSVAIIDVPEGTRPKPGRLAELSARFKRVVKSDRGRGWRRFPFEAANQGGA